MFTQAAYFIDVVLPIPLEKKFTYAITNAEANFLKPGMRVAVPFGKNKIYTSIVINIHQTPPDAYEAKDIFQILDETPIITELQLKHWEWVADYYMCTLGDVVKAALPSVFLLESETLVVANREFEKENVVLNFEENIIVEALTKKTHLSVSDIMKLLNKKNVFPILKKLIEVKAISLEEEIFEQYQPKLDTHIVLGNQFRDNSEGLQSLLSTLKSEKQRNLLMAYFTEIVGKKSIKKKDLLAKSGVSEAVLKTMIKNQIFELQYLQVDRVSFESENQQIPILSSDQETAYKEIQTAWLTKSTCLLHGVTGSGKTAVYIHLIKEQLQLGKQVLFLIPEIALTTQLINRLKVYFGDYLSVFHSKYTLNERAEVWVNLLNQKQKAQFIIGTRSAVFLPFTNIGLIVVDEEHETSYKQFDPAPRFNARDTAIVLANYFNAKLLLGSATPSLEVYNKTKINQYGLVKLDRRFGNVLLPKIELVDIKEKHKKKLMTGHFSDTLIEAIKNTLLANEQVILFQNRRGYAPLIECNTCGVSPQCPNCDVSLTVHQLKNQLRCHYCDYNRAIPKQCDACGSIELDSKGFGTEQIENELIAIFPEYKIGRLDLDSTKGKHGFEKIINAFQNGEIDILVGTQMLTKGLDFGNVGLVGVMNADNMLNFPDYRAHERSFQLLTQVSGRSGRSKKQGLVLIQTFNPYHQILQQVTTHSYDQMFTEQLTDRRNFLYPPHYRIIQITLKHKDFVVVNDAAHWLGKSYKNAFQKNLLGPTVPSIGRVRNLYIQQLIIKIPPKQSIADTKIHIKKVMNLFQTIGRFKSVRINIDVDAY